MGSNTCACLYCVLWITSALFASVHGLLLILNDFLQHLHLCLSLKYLPLNNMVFNLRILSSLSFADFLQGILGVWVKQDGALRRISKTKLMEDILKVLTKLFTWFCQSNMWSTLCSHLFCSSGEINPFNLGMIREDRMKIFSWGLTQFTGELQQTAFLIIQGFLGKQKSDIIKGDLLCIMHLDFLFGVN